MVSLGMGFFNVKVDILPEISVDLSSFMYYICNS